MSASKHPAQGPSKPIRSQQKPVDGEDGFTGSVFEQRKRAFEERDNPNVSERKGE
jgi:hypothetical protein